MIIIEGYVPFHMLSVDAGWLLRKVHEYDKNINSLTKVRSSRIPDKKIRTTLRTLTSERNGLAWCIGVCEREISDVLEAREKYMKK